MSYTGVTLDELIQIKMLYSVHYFEYMSNFSFGGESHDFWEFIYVDKGEVEITADTDKHILKKGEIAFHKPNEFHDVAATGYSAPNLIVISFQCTSPYMSFFENKILKIDHPERQLLANIILEAQNCFEGSLNDTYQTTLIEKNNAFAGKQFIRNYLEEFLLHIIRRYDHASSLCKELDKTPKANVDSDIFDRVTAYLDANTRCKLSIDQICRANLIGRSQLQKLFNDKTGLGVIDYFSKLKIESAKELIRMNKMNFTQISEYLGYSSIHYFSRQFKKITGMTPSEYASSIKALTNRKF